VDLRRCLARVVAGGEPPDGVRPPIGPSWRRSVASGLRPDRFDVPFDPDVDGDGALVRAAQPVLDQLAGDLAGAGVGVVLADARGHVLDRRVSEMWLADLLDRVLLAPGYVHAEDAVGTNGIGTSLVGRGPSSVEGDEHFADALTGVAGSAAPIADPGSGQMIGAVDLTCLATQASPLMLPLATWAARDIEQRLIDDTGLPERLLLHRFLQTRRGAKGPFVLFTERRMVANAAADRLLAPEDEPTLRRSAVRLRAADGRGSVMLELSRAGMVSLRVEPLPDGGSRDGILLRLAPVAGTDRRRSDDVAAVGWESLTGAERSVAELVAQGLTNREAAERLFLSHHTVGFHLRSVFRKLGTNTRVDLARLAVESQQGEVQVGSRPSNDMAVPTSAS
jgi:transcriptional regulator of acetoin/glycerol metabolism/DNA-binding CsgD family transcriptional regulator